MNRRVIVVALVVATALVGQISAQTVYDPAVDFSDQNPNGVWSYVGYNPFAGGFTPIGYYNRDINYTEDWIGLGVPAWYFNENNCPAIAANTTGADVSYLTSFTMHNGLITMHPDAKTSQLLYFTAPQPGYYDISAIMTASDTGNTAADLSDGKDGPAVAVYRWSTAGDPEYGGGFASKKVGEAWLPIFGDSYSYSVTNEFMNAGDVVAFEVYPDGDNDGDWMDFAYDAVECDINITRVTDATLDLTWGLENGNFEAPTLAGPAVTAADGWLKMPNANDVMGMYTAHKNLPGDVPAEGNQTFFLDSREKVSGSGGDVFQCVGALDEMSDVTLSLIVGGSLEEGTPPPAEYEVGFWTDTTGDCLPDTALATIIGTPTEDAYENISVTAEDVAAGIPVFVRLRLTQVTTGAYQTFFDDLVLTVGGSPEPAPGDANKDGKVDGSDVTILAGNWQKGVDDGQTAIWDDGDFNGDGKVDGSDVTILAGNWQYGVETTAASVPEPSTLAMLLYGALCTLWLSRRK